MSSKNNVRPGSTNNVRLGSLNNVRGGGLTSTLVWAVALQPVNTTIGGYTAEILGGIAAYPIPSGQTGYPHLSEMISSGLSVASDGTTNNGTGLVQVGASAGATINLAFNPYFSTLGYSIPEDSISPFLYQFESAGLLGSTANFYTYLSFTGLPGPTYAGLSDTGTLQWNGYHLTE